MGIERRVQFTSRPLPDWAVVVQTLNGAGLSVQMRLIDGELAFPDETPPPGWRELRVAHDGAMVTVRRGANEVVLVAWGNADAAQRRLWDALTWAFAQVGAGEIQTDSGVVDAATFASQVGLR